MDIYYCLILVRGKPTPQLEMLEALSLGEALLRLASLADQWPGMDGVELYRCNDFIEHFSSDDLRRAA